MHKARRKHRCANIDNSNYFQNRQKNPLQDNCIFCTKFIIKFLLKSSVNRHLSSRKESAFPQNDQHRKKWDENRSDDQSNQPPFHAWSVCLNEDLLKKTVGQLPIVRFLVYLIDSKSIFTRQISFEHRVFGIYFCIPLDIENIWTWIKI